MDGFDPEKWVVFGVCNAVVMRWRRKSGQSFASGRGKSLGKAKKICNKAKALCEEVIKTRSRTEGPVIIQKSEAFAGTSMTQKRNERSKAIPVTVTLLPS